MYCVVISSRVVNTSSNCRHGRANVACLDLSLPNKRAKFLVSGLKGVGCALLSFVFLLPMKIDTLELVV